MQVTDSTSLICSHRHPYSNRVNGSAYSQLNNHDDTLTSRLLAPGIAAPENSQSWTNPCPFHVQNASHVHSLPDTPPIFHPPCPTRLLPEMDVHQILTPNNGPFTYPIQTPSLQTNTCALPIHYSPSMNSNAGHCYQEPPHVNANSASMFGSSTSVSIGSPQIHLDSITTTNSPSSWPADLQPHLPCEPPSPEPRRYRPGKEPAAEFEPNPIILRESCKRDAGSAFAVDWTLVVFHHGVTKEALLRTLDRGEIGLMVNFPGGFEPRQAYDGFISKIGDRYECGLCKEGKRTCWKNKKDAPRHLRKFHFGIGDPCGIWCVLWAPYWDYLNLKLCILPYSGKNVYSNGEMKTHGCVPVA